MLKHAINGIVWRDIRWKYLKLLFSFILHCKPENNTQFQPTLGLTILCRITHFYQIWSVECLLCVLSRVMVKLLNVRDFFSMNPKNLWWFAILNTINTWVEGIYGKRSDFEVSSLYKDHFKTFKYVCRLSVKEKPNYPKIYVTPICRC